MIQLSSVAENKKPSSSRVPCFGLEYSEIHVRDGNCADLNTCGRLLAGSSAIARRSIRVGHGFSRKSGCARIFTDSDSDKFHCDCVRFATLFFWTIHVLSLTYTLTLIDVPYSYCSIVVFIGITVVTRRKYESSIQPSLIGHLNLRGISLDEYTLLTLKGRNSQITASHTPHGPFPAGDIPITHAIT